MRWLNRESAALAWLILFLLINAYWISYDLWAHFTHHRLMTTQMRDWLHEELAGPLIFGLLVFIVAAFFWHMLIRASK